MMPGCVHLNPHTNALVIARVVRHSRKSCVSVVASINVATFIVAEEVALHRLDLGDITAADGHAVIVGVGVALGALVSSAMFISPCHVLDLRCRTCT
jgi:hypothetical protein